MSRVAFHVRGVEIADAEELVELWETPYDAPHDTTRQDVPSTVRKVIASDKERIIVAESGGRIIGALYLRIGPIMPLTSDEAVFASMLRVTDQFRKRGVAHALIEAGVSWAEEHGVHHVVSISSGSRDTSRFLARLGLTPAATLRVAPTVALRARLPREVPALVRTGVPGPRPVGQRPLGQVLAARRSMRRSGLNQA